MTPRKRQQLTDREKQVIQLVRDGLSNRQIADAMSVSEKTVRNKLTIIYSKLSIKNRENLIFLKN
jgi:DNA-binding CsgD family transcriptional regulator